MSEPPAIGSGVPGTDSRERRRTQLYVRRLMRQLEGITYPVDAVPPGGASGGELVDLTAVDESVETTG